MKILKYLGVVFCCVAALSLTACNDDDEQKSLTKEDVANCFLTVKGNYSGKLMYYTGEKKNDKFVKDSVLSTWSIQSDSVLTIDKFPSKALAAFVSDSTVKKALEAAPAQDLKCRIGFVQTSPVAFIANPITPTFNLNYGGADHKVQVVFYINNTASYGVYSAAGKAMTIQLIEGPLFIDGKQTSYQTQSVPLLMTGNKI